MKKHIALVLRLVVAIILLQTLRFKFTAHPDSVYIFEKVGLEPFGRIGVGLLELVTAILVLVPKTVWIGALLTLGIIGGAIFLHLTQIGIEVKHDGGLLFTTAIVTFVLSGILLFMYRHPLIQFTKRFFN